MSEWKPNLFLIGAAKAGTTSLTEWLGSCPSVFVSRIKEPHFFSDVSFCPELQGFIPVVRDIDDYLKLFKQGAGMRYRLDASTSYLVCSNAPNRIKEFSNDAKIIVILRNPVDRAFSHYLNDVREGSERRSFLQALNEEMTQNPDVFGAAHMYLPSGLYVRQLSRYLDAFGVDNVSIYCFEELIADSASVKTALLSFLNLDTGQAQINSIERRNTYAVPSGSVSQLALSTPWLRKTARVLIPYRTRRFVRNRLLFKPAAKPSIDSQSKDMLIDYYSNDVKALKRLLPYFPWHRWTYWQDKQPL